MNISVIICTYNPNLKNLAIVLKSLQEQTLPKNEWRLIVIDNKSSFQVKDNIDISWHPNHVIVREDKPGLLNARIAGFNLAAEPLIVFVDDDNVLKADYLEIALSFYNENPQVGSFGGKSLPVFEVEPPAWFYDTNISLGCQNYGDETIISGYNSGNFKVNEYPFYAPIGTGMVITKKALQIYIDEVRGDLERLKLGRTGTSLYSGEDNDVVLTIIKSGFEIAYVPELIVNHIIPKERLSIKYLSKMAFSSSKSWVKLLNAHHMCPWKTIPKWSLSIRKIKSWLLYKAWASPVNYIKWRGACGTFEALSEIN